MQSRTPAHGPQRLARAMLLAAAMAAAAATAAARAEGAASAAAANGIDVPPLGALRAATCVTCHGAARPVPGSQIPRLVGMPAQRIEQAMRDYAAQAAPGDLMGQIARGYDAQTVALIAHWYAGLAPEAP